MSGTGQGGARRHVVCFGLGYTVRELIRQARGTGLHLSGTCRDAETAADWRKRGVDATAWTAGAPLPPQMLDGVSDLLISVPPDAGGCSVLRALGFALPAHVRWVGYLSSSAVYGNVQGAWIDETQPTAPLSEDGANRCLAEAQWSAAASAARIALDRFRMAGIYGPDGRSAFDHLRAQGSRARAIVKPGQVFNRIHVEDAARAVLAAMQAPAGDRVLNLADDLPAAAADVMAYAATLAGLPPPERVPFDPATLPPGFAGFYAENRRLRNDGLKALAGFNLRYPDYRAGLTAIAAARQAGGQASAI